MNKVWKPTKEGVASMINDQVRALNKSQALYKPDLHAGFILVDPVVIAALDHWWNEYQRLLAPSHERME